MTADPTTFSDLKTSLANWLNRDDLSTTEIPEAIAFAERRFQRTVFCPERLTLGSITADAASESLPADFWGLESLPYVDDTTDHVLQQVEIADLRAAYPDGTTGTPAHFAIEGESIYFGPIPSSSLTIKVPYWATIPALSGSQTTNWLLTDHPDLYLHASLAELYILLRDLEGSQIHEAKARALLDEVNSSGRRRKMNSGPLTASPSISSVRNIQA